MPPASVTTRGRGLFRSATGKSRPVRLNAMQQAGTADKAGLAALPQVTGEPQFPTQAQTDAAQQAVAKGWAAATA